MRIVGKLHTRYRRQFILAITRTSIFKQGLANAEILGLTDEPVPSYCVLNFF